MRRDDCRVEYDSENRRLVYFGNDADETYWDDHWAERLVEKDVKRADPFVVAWTRRYLPPGARVLDGGCGLGNTVWGLQQAGYDAVGVDYASETVAAVNRIAPELTVLQADVHDLPFPTESLDGVWSLGVIEHFPQGYGGITQEMWRILKPGGYAFVTVPAMSPVRRWKAARGAYPSFSGQFERFYQFVLASEAVVQSFEAQGWQHVRSVPRGGFKGLKDEWDALRPALQRVYDSKFKLARYARAGLNRALAPMSYHTKLFVFRKPVDRPKATPD
jgi:SAM-dependent methyltransferase